jgi:hypothetical protein
MARKLKKRTRKPIWKRPGPKGDAKPLSRRQKAKAKRAAKRAGRPYPNAVDNINASKSE